MPIDPSKQRQILGHFATGVTIITTGDTTGNEWGMTANSVTSLSLTPPLILFTINRLNKMLGQLATTPCFAINILRADQEHLSRRFAAPGPKDFAGIRVVFGTNNTPIFADCLGFVECEVYQYLSGGDHKIVIGKVVDGNLFGGEPLIFYGGGYNSIVHNLESPTSVNYTLQESYEQFGAF